MRRKKSVDEVLKEYSGKISNKISHEEKVGNVSREYKTFKTDMVPRLSRYENFVKAFSFFSLNLAKKDRVKMQRSLNVAHLDITPGQVAVASLFGAFLTLL